MDALDVGDLQQELDELTDERETYQAYLEGDGDEEVYPSSADKVTAMALCDWDEDREQRFTQLTALLNEVTEENNPLILKDDWVDYVQELCEEIGAVPRDTPSYIEIDWKATAENVRADYNSVEFNGLTYYYRCV